MQSSTTTSYARYRLLSSVGGKLADALGVVLAIKTLSAADYGVIGTAMGLMAVVGFVNLAPEDVLWRDLPRLGDRLGEYLSACVWFWLVKFAVVAGVAALFCLIGRLTPAVLAITLLLQLLGASTLLEVPLFAGLQQRSGAIFVLGVRVLWLALLAVNIWWRTLPYYVAALAMYAGATAALSAWLLHRQFGVRFHFRVADAWPKVRAAALDLTLWLHLVGKARVFLQRGDLAILGCLGLSLAAVGQYTVAVNLAGFALIVPGVLENIAAVSFTHQPEARTRNLRRYYLAAAGLAVAQFAGGVLLGRTALRLLHVADVEASHRIFLTLLGGVSVLIVASPAFAYAMCFRKMRTVFGSVFLPSAVIFALAVWGAARQWGVAGAATAHATIAAITGAAMIGVIVFGHDEPSAVAPSTAEAESAFQE